MTADDATASDAGVESREEVKAEPSTGTEKTPVDAKETEAATVDDSVDLNAAPETPEEPGVEAEASEDASEAPAEETEGAEEEGEEEPPEMVEFNFGGDKLEVEKGSLTPEVAERLQKFSDGIWKDYTTKSQTNAETAKQLEAREAAISNMANLNGEALQTYSQGLHVRQEIEQLSQVDMTALWQSDPDQARQLSDQLASKQAEFNAIVAKVGQYENNLQEAQQSEIARRAEEGKAILDRRIKGFSAEKAPDVVRYAVEQGMTQEDANQWALNPRVTEMAYKAMMFDRMQAKAKTPNPKPKLVAPVKPMKAVGGGNQTNTPDKMSDDQFAKYLGMSA